MEVKYHTRLKNSTSQRDWEVDGICRHMRRHGGGVELGVNGKGGKETWELTKTWRRRTRLTNKIVFMGS